MANAADKDAAPAWYLRVGRVMGAGLTGAAVGGAVAGIWQAGLEAANNACRGTDEFCIGVVPVAQAIFGSVLVIAVGVFVGFGGLRIRPRRLTIPVGCILAATLTWASAAAMPGRMAPPPWAAAVAAGAGLAAVALSVDSGRLRIAGIIAVAVIVIAAFVLPDMIASRIRADTSEHELAALGFPLLLPDVPGYRATNADAANGGLGSVCHRTMMTPTDGPPSRSASLPGPAAGRKRSPRSARMRQDRAARPCARACGLRPAAWEER
jgi:hypothetical protein